MISFMMIIWFGFKDENLLPTLVIIMYFNQTKGFLLPLKYLSIICEEKYTVLLIYSYSILLYSY